MEDDLKIKKLDVLQITLSHKTIDHVKIEVKAMFAKNCRVILAPARNAFGHLGSTGVKQNHCPQSSGGIIRFVCQVCLIFKDPSAIGIIVFYICCVKFDPAPNLKQKRALPALLR